MADEEEEEEAERCVGEGGCSDVADKGVCDGSDASSWIGSKAGDKRGERRGDSRGEISGDSDSDSVGDAGDSRGDNLGGVPGPCSPCECSPGSPGSPDDCSEGNNRGETLGESESVIPFVEVLLLVASASNSLIL